MHKRKRNIKAKNIEYLSPTEDFTFRNKLVLKWGAGEQQEPEHIYRIRQVSGKYILQTDWTNFCDASNPDITDHCFYVSFSVLHHSTPALQENTHLLSGLSNVVVIPHQGMATQTQKNSWVFQTHRPGFKC